MHSIYIKEKCLRNPNLGENMQTKNRYSVKVTHSDGSVLWIVHNLSYEFTKSKAEFILSCAIKRGLYQGCELEVVSR